jgi:hypothetical protein
MISALMSGILRFCVEWRILSISTVSTLSILEVSVNEKQILEMRVFQTAVHLDFVRPEWEERVNIIRLNIAQPGECIGGQCARGTRRKEQAYLVFLEELGYSQENAFLLGVDFDRHLAMSRSEQFLFLKKCWLIEVNHRICAKEEARREAHRIAIREIELKLQARLGPNLIAPVEEVAV